MNKQEFTAAYIARNFPVAKPGMRARGVVSDAAKVQRAEAAYAEFMSTNRVKARELIANGGQEWQGERVYFNAVPVPSSKVGRTEDVYFDIANGAWLGDAEAVAAVCANA